MAQPRYLPRRLQDLQILQYLVSMKSGEGRQLLQGAGPPGQEVDDQSSRPLRPLRLLRPLSGPVSGPFGDHLGAGEDLQHPHHLHWGDGLDRLRRRPHHRIELDPIGIDLLGRLGDEGGLGVVEARDEHHLQPDLAGILPPEADEPLDDLLDRQVGVGAVDTLEGRGRRGVQGGDDQVRLKNLPADLLAEEEGPVRQEGDGLIDRLLRPPDDLVEPPVEERLPGAGEGEVVELLLSPLLDRLRPGPDLRQDLGRGDATLTIEGEAGSRPQLAVDAVEGAGLEGEEVDPQGEAEPPGWYGAEEVAHDLRPEELILDSKVEGKMY
ncbi:MAG: hypothetical protein METHAR1v1_100012 [Methanothrix sp.]|nr:MAG: hypothetical protein METHAR1v1_100012 [Methanothrix sp.]